MLVVKRIYAPPDRHDGTRILVDRLWPRGVSRDRACLDHWLKDIAPSDMLRRRFHGDEGDWAEFCVAYAQELASAPRQPVDLVLDCARRGPVSLLFAARNEVRNNAVALKAWLDERIDASDP